MTDNCSPDENVCPTSGTPARAGYRGQTVECPECGKSIVLGGDIHESRGIVPRHLKPDSERSQTPLTSNPRALIDELVGYVGVISGDQIAFSRLLQKIEAQLSQIERLTRERDQLLAAIGEHVTVRSDQYGEIQRLTRELERRLDRDELYQERLQLLSRLQAAAGGYQELGDSMLKALAGRDRLRAALNDAQKQLGALAVLILQSDHDETLEWARGVKVTFANGEPTVSVESPVETKCQHDLTKPDTTVIVAGPYDASCPVCKGEWHIPHPPEKAPERQPLEQHPDYCHAHGDHLIDSPACELARERERRSEKATGELTQEEMERRGQIMRELSAKASVCMGCNSTPCVCAELGSAQEASGESDKCPECGWFKGLHNAGCSRMNEGRAAAEVPR